MCSTKAPTSFHTSTRSRRRRKVRFQSGRRYWGCEEQACHQVGPEPSLMRRTAPAFVGNPGWPRVTCSRASPSSPSSPYAAHSNPVQIQLARLIEIEAAATTASAASAAIASSFTFGLKDSRPGTAKRSDAACCLRD